MSVYHNDIDPDLIPKGRGVVAWTSEHSVQILVFITGAVLTLMAYIIINLLVKEMVEEDMRQVVSDTQQVLRENASELEYSINSAALIVKQENQSGINQIEALIGEALPEHTSFERLMWIRPQEQGNSKIDNLYVKQDGQGFLPQWSPALEKLIVSYIEESIRDIKADTMILTDLPILKPVHESTTHRIESFPFLIVKRLTTEDEGEGEALSEKPGEIVAGLIHGGKALNLAWVKKKQSIAKLYITDKNSNELLASISALEKAPRPGMHERFSIPVGNSEWEVLYSLGRDSRMAFIEKISLLIFFFGTALTFIGTLYVHSNQRQAKRLAVMNEALAEKNYELNIEVTERERLYDDLQKAESEYKSIINSVNDIIFEATDEGEVSFVNNTWKRITGFDREQVLNRNIFSMLHPQDQEEQRHNFENLMHGHENTFRTYTRLRSADGSFRAMELSISLLKNEGRENSVRIVGTFTDVEERRRAETALSEAEKKYRTIVENAAGGIYQITPEGQYLSANPAMARILGYPSQDSMLKEIRNANSDVYMNAKERLKFLRELDNKGAVYNYETRVTRRDGSKIWVNENARAVKDEDGDTLYYEGSMEDVDQRKTTELKLKEAKIQSDIANRAKSEFLANMSHELRTPLNAIIGFAEILKDEVLGPIENRQYWDYTRDIHASGRQLLKVINEILDVSRIEAGERPLNEGNVNMDELISNCLEFTSTRMSEKGLIAANMTAGEVPNIIGEELAIKQILLNLLSNAIKFTPHGGRVTISHEIDNSGRLHVSVTDTGVGLNESEVEKALSPFGQIDSTFSRSESGTGLGLTLVDSLIRLHGGRLELFSQKSIGTTATIIFPAKRIAVKSIEEEAEESADDETSSRGRGDDKSGSRLTH